jgi:hypothetical protein
MWSGSKYKTPPWYLYTSYVYTSLMGSYGRVSLGEDSDSWGLCGCCELLSAGWTGDWVGLPVLPPIPEIMLPSAKQAI